jgi:hypothetical protein
MAGEPRADLSAVKVQRTVEGKLQEWTVDLRSENGAVKEVPARMSDGDRIIIPLRPPDDAEALAKRRKGIFQAAPGRVFGAQIFTWREKDHAPRTLGEFLVESYRASEMVIPDPDLSRIIIHRLKTDTGEEEHLPADFAKAISTGPDLEPEEARKLDVPLEWGDIVEISSREVPVADWAGLGSRAADFFNRALGERHWCRSVAILAAMVGRRVTHVSRQAAPDERRGANTRFLVGQQRDGHCYGGDHSFSAEARR